MRRYKRLRQALRDAGISHEAAARALGISEATFSRRMTDKSDWTLSEAHRLMRLTGEPPEKMAEVFPPNGISHEDAFTRSEG